jgi:hypothetical protein
MAIDTSLFSGQIGSLRLMTLIIGAIDVGITVDHYWNEKEEFFFWTIVILLVVSAILAVAALFSLQSDAPIVRKVETLFHGIGGIVLLVAAVLMIISVIDRGESKSGSTGKFIQRLAAGILGILNGLVYCSLGWSVCRRSN